MEYTKGKKIYKRKKFQTQISFRISRPKSELIHAFIYGAHLELFEVLESEFSMGTGIGISK